MSTIINGSSPSITFSDGSTQTKAAVGAGATVTSSAANITLTSASNQVQQITMTATGLTVILPDATTYTSGALGGSIFVISNTGTNYFDIKNSTGFVVFGLNIGQTCTISLSGITTQNQWVGNLLSNTTISSTRGALANITTTVPTWTAANQNMQVAALSSTLIVAVWLNSNTGFSYAAAGSISGTTITWGTPTAISVVRAYNFVNIAALSGTTALIGSIAVGTGSYYNGISVSGTTITVSTISAAGTTGDSTQYPLLPLTSTTAILFYGNTAAGVAGRVVTYNGASAPTFGTAVNNASTAGPNIFPVVLSSTSVLVFSDNNGAGTFGYRVWSVSGTTLTIPTAQANLPTTYFTGGSSSCSLIAISSTEAVLTSAQTTVAQKMTISGTVVTPSTVWANQAYKILVQNNGANQLLSATDFLATSGPTTAPSFTRYSYNTTTGVSVVGVSPFPALITAYGYCYVTTNTAAVVGLDSNNYPSGYLVYIT